MCVALPLVVFAVANMCYGMADAAEVKPPTTYLKWHYYKITNTCRDVEEYVRHEVKLFWDNDRSITPKLLRLVYSDCFITVCTLNFLPYLFWYCLKFFFSTHFSTFQHKGKLAGLAAEYLTL